MKFPFIGLMFSFLVSAPIAVQATDFQIDKIVNEALARAQADQEVALSTDAPKGASPTYTNVDLQTQKTDPQNVHPE